MDILRDNDYDAILLDILMPELDGFGVCKAVRRNSNVPILFLTALDGEEDTLKGYALGCDDYMAKPFSLAVLFAKTQALIRRRNGCNPVLQEEIKLSPREYDLLLCLMRNQGNVLSREQLLDKVWGFDFEGEDRAVDVRIRSLRSALGPAGRQIKTIYKAGYKLEEV